MTIALTLTQTGRSAILEVASTDGLSINPDFSFDIAATLNGAEFDIADAGGSGGAISANTDTVNGRFAGTISGSAIGNIPAGAPIITVRFDVQSTPGNIEITSFSGTLNEIDQTAAQLPSLALAEPGPDTAEIIEGDFILGGTLTVDLDALPDWDVFGSEPTASIQWLRAGQPIPGATERSYTLQQQDVTSEISVRVSYTDRADEQREVSARDGAIVELSATHITGNDGADTLEGTLQDNTIAGRGGDDKITGGGGDDSIDGGAGTDSALYAGDQSDYTLTLAAGQITITDRRGSEGTDSLTSVEFLDFGNELEAFGETPMNLDAFDDGTALDAAQFASIVELYIAYFNRAPDAIGLNFWASSFARGDVDMARMAELFFDQSETRTAYASALNEDGSQITDVSAFVTAIYTNVLGRAPDAGGRDFWTGVLERGEVTPGSAISSIIAGAKADAPEGATQAEIDARALDQQYLSNATDIGVHFAVINGMSDTGNADAVMQLLTREAASVDAAVAQSNAYLAEAQAATGGEFLMQLVGVIDDPFAG